MRRAIRIFVTVGVLSAVVIVGLQVIQAQQRARADEQIAASLIQDEATVKTDDLQVTISATGPIIPARQVSLIFELSVPVSQVMVKEGDIVHKGDVLARLDTSDLDAALTNAQIALQSQQTAYNALVAPARDVDITAAKAALVVAQASANASYVSKDPNQEQIARLQTEIARNQLWQQQLQGVKVKDFPEALRLQYAPNSSPSALRNQEYSVQLADIGYDKAKAEGPDIGGLSAANAQIVSAQAELDRLVNGPTAIQKQITETQLAIAQLTLDQAQSNLNRAVLTAPFDGVVAKNNLVIGEVPPQDAAIKLIDSHQFYVDVAVDETDIADLQVGQPVNLKLDALPDAKITGKVNRIAVTSVKVGQLVTYSVRVLLDPTSEPVRVGMSSNATIVVKELHDVLTVPNRFIRIDRATQKAFVTVERPDKGFQEVEVKLGLRNETNSQIVTGLASGQRVVLLPRGSFNPIDS
jgi:HlyD family secretion protein